MVANVLLFVVLRAIIIIIVIIYDYRMHSAAKGTCATVCRRLCGRNVRTALFGLWIFKRPNHTFHLQVGRILIGIFFQHFFLVLVPTRYLLYEDRTTVTIFLLRRVTRYITLSCWYDDVLEFLFPSPRFNVDHWP